MPRNTDPAKEIQAALMTYLRNAPDRGGRRQEKRKAQEAGLNTTITE